MGEVCVCVCVCVCRRERAIQRDSGSHILFMHSGQLEPDAHWCTTILSEVKTWWLFETSAEDYTAAPACRAANQPASLSFLLILSRNCSLKAQSDDSRGACVLFHWNRTKSLGCLVKMSTCVFVFFCLKLIVIPNLFSGSTAPPAPPQPHHWRCSLHSSVTTATQSQPAEEIL